MLIKELREFSRCNIIAYNGRDGKILFDTSKNKKEYVDKYNKGEVLCIWADMKQFDNVFGGYYKPVIKCYITNESWKGEE